MKYIRTKDRVFETSRLPIERFSVELVKIIDKQTGLPNPHIEEIEIIKQADTIAELCDEFVVEDTQGLHYRTTCFKGLENISNKVFGAIWTDKGLIYVAKMKGVLPDGSIDWELL